MRRRTGSAPEGPGPQQFNLVHGVRVSNDGLVYVADRMNNRMQVFTIDGKFQREIFVERKTKLLGTSFSVAFSPDAAQQYLYLADAGNGKVHIYDRKTLEEVGSFGRIGHYAGEFVFLHNVSRGFEGQHLHGGGRQRAGGSRNSSFDSQGNSWIIINTKDTKDTEVFFHREENSFVSIVSLVSMKTPRAGY